MTTLEIHKALLKAGSEWIPKYHWGDIVDRYKAERSDSKEVDPGVKYNIVNVNKYFVGYTIEAKGQDAGTTVHKETVKKFIEDNKPNEKVNYGLVEMGIVVGEHKNRGKLIHVKAIKSCAPFFNEGANVFIQSVLHTEDKVLHNGMASYFHKDSPKSGNFGNLPSDLSDKPLGTTREVKKSQFSNNEGQMVMVAMEPTIALVGSYKSSIIILADGTEYPDSILGGRCFSDVFRKV